MARRRPGDSGRRGRGPARGPRQRDDGHRQERPERTAHRDHYDDEIGDRQDLPEVEAGDSANRLFGLHPVKALLTTNPGRVSRLHLLDQNRSHGIGELVTLAKSAKIPFSHVDRMRLDQMADTTKHQGVVADVAPVAYETLDDVLARCEGRPDALVMLLDQVEDPRNLGAILRTAEACGAHGVIIPKRRAAPMTSLVAKVSAGACFHLPPARVENLAQAMKTLQQAGFWLVGLDGEADIPLSRVKMVGPTVLVMGGEGKGLRPLVKRNCDVVARIPLSGQTPSLNVSVAAAMSLYEVCSQRGWGIDP